MNVYTVAHYHSCHKMQRMSQIQNNIVAVVLQVATAIETIDMEHLRFNKSTFFFFFFFFFGLTLPNQTM